jgi:hypothetical protein
MLPYPLEDRVVGSLEPLAGFRLRARALGARAEGASGFVLKPHLRRRSVSPHVLLLGVSAAMTVTAVTVAGMGFPITPVAPRSASVVPLANTPIDIAPLQASRSRSPAAFASASTMVSPLRRVLMPDVLITTTHPLSAVDGTARRHLQGVTGSTILRTGLVHVGKVPVHATAVDPSQFRAFTPHDTAASDALWAAVARGELAPDYSTKLPLGKTFQVQGKTRVKARIGAVASLNTYGIPGSDLIVNRTLGDTLGLIDTSALIAAPDRSLTGPQA